MPKLLAVPIGVKGLAIGGSAFAHLTFAFVAMTGGHSMARASVPDPRADEVEIEPEPTPEPPKPVDDDEDDDHPHATPHASPTAHSHHHDYPVAPSHDTTPHDPRLVHAPLAPAAPLGDVPSNEPAPVVAAPTSAPVRITITVGNGPGAASTVGGSGSSSTPSAPPPAPEIVAESVVSVPARAISSVRPRYPPSARASEIEADVTLEIVVDANGSVIAARTTRTVGYGMDDAALQAIRRFRFSPAQRNGQAVGVRMRWVMQFRLQ